jgi:hypothetical protein
MRWTGLVVAGVVAGCSNDISVQDNTDPPTVEIIVPLDQAVFDPLDPVVFCANVGGGTGDGRELSLASDLDGVIATEAALGPCDGGNAGGSFQLSDGDHTLELVVTDHRGRQASDSVRVMASPNDTPACALALPLPDTVFEEGAEVRVEGTVTDEAPEAVTATIVSDLDGTVYEGAPTLAGAIDARLAGLSIGRHTLALSAVDPRGAVGLCTVAIDVVECVDTDGDGFSTCDGDCDDTDPDVFPGATELPNGIDDDCDSVTDEDTELFDDDGDGFTELQGDCDDDDVTVNPDEPDLPDDGIDQDCSGDDTVSCFEDLDQDGRGSTVVVLGTDGDCFDPGESEVDIDCDDTDPAAFPGAPEILGDGIDQDCDGTDAAGCYVDLDNDGYGDTSTVITSYDGDCDDAGESAIGGDCDDGDADIHPGVTDTPDDGIDQDCSGDDTVSCFADVDLDGYGGPTVVLASDGDCLQAGETATSEDCDDTDAYVHPGAAEVLDDGIDQDCSGDDAVTCADDGDFDGHGHPTDTVVATDGDCADPGESTTTDDCDDTDGTVFPGAAEVPDDGVDQDCSGTDAVTCFVDGDLDGVGGPTTDVRADGDCADPGESLLGTDCDDSDGARYPGAIEVPDNGIDEDCSGADLVLCIQDADNDGYGTDAGTTVPAPDGDCDDLGESTTADDCDDTDAGVHPGVTDLFGNGADENCDGLDGVDGDGDGFAADFTGGLDCDDADPSVNPAAPEAANGLDDNCDLLCDEGLIGPGDLVLTELMINPSAVADGDGEWFELKNTTATDIALCAGWSFSDLGGNGFSIADPAVVVPAGGYAVFAVQADPALNGGVLPDATYPYAASGGMQLGQSGDELIIEFDGALIDAFLWTSGFDPTGASKQVAGGLEDDVSNDAEGSWCTASTPMSGGDAGTPGFGPDC